MMQYNPFLKLNRLLIYSRHGKVAYDETFHDGVNIIRGRNSSGKSTIANFIFYALGGDFKKWTTSALSCEDVYAEVFINTEPITLKRKVTDVGMQPMSIFWGPLDQAIKSASEGWFIYSYKRSSEKKSFSNALFLSLGFPELRGDVDSNITMHQILRLLYIDQKSLTLDLLMTETFDSSITRKTIADLLFGVYDDSLYSDKISFREAQKDYEVKKKQYEGIEAIYKSSDNEVSPQLIKEKIDENNKQIVAIDAEYDRLKAETIFSTDQAIEHNTKIIAAKTKLFDARNNLADVQAKINSYQLELLDSRDFILSLEKRAEALAESELTRSEFSDLKMTHCPNCLLPLTHTVATNHCELCHQLLPEDKGSSQLKRMQQEIDNQIRESKKLYEENEHKYLEYLTSLPTINETVNSSQLELDEILNSFKSNRDEKIDSLLIRKGEIKSQNEYLIKQLKAIEQIEILRQELESLNALIHRLGYSINEKEKNQRIKLSNAYSKIEEFALTLLHSDLGRQAEFSHGKKVELDFEKNTFALDGENNFSESSNVYLKNSVRFAIFFASLVEAFFRLPRFVLCDNIEDKGMEPDRSQSFQKEIVRLSLEATTRHQIIITTSMISPELNDTELCVGDFYTEENKTLRL